MNLNSKNTLNFNKLYLIAVFLAALFFVLLAIIIGANKASGEGESFSENKLVNIYDRGAKTVVVSESRLVKDALKQSGIELDEHDRTVPSLDTKVSSAEYNVNIYRARPVLIVDGNIKRPVISSFQTGEEIVKNVGISLRSEDIVKLEQSSSLSDGAGLKASILRATPVNLTFFGKNEVVYTQSKTVGDFIDERNIAIGDNVKLSHNRSDIIEPNMPLRIWKEGKQTITVEEEVPFAIEKIQDADKSPGFKEIRQPGKNGKRTATYDIVVQDGEEVSRVETNSIIIDQPVKQIEVHGARFVYTGGPLNEAQITALGTCESGMTATRNSGNGFYGAFQFMPSTWRSVAPAPYNSVLPHQAPLDAQKQAVQNLLSRSNIFNQFPGCAKKMRANGIL